MKEYLWSLVIALGNWILTISGARRNAPGFEPEDGDTL